MASRLDRLFVLLESCPNETLRATAARQLGELAQKAPEDVDAILARVCMFALSYNQKSAYLSVIWRSVLM
ncbi:hypothetical protein ECG_09249 [Echinococcus granulosus]|uniref:Helicase n=1 Tax=Echinococcus granulosus TaxID=6210 RepID=A0A068X0H6_ECHGR|nr:hypothetical protein ECG_09249 [Echinococcus granulosus]CDS23414.1 helicase [Echinococcus granulosus]